MLKALPLALAVLVLAASRAESGANAGNSATLSWSPTIVLQDLDEMPVGHRSLYLTLSNLQELDQFQIRFDWAPVGRAALDPDAACTLCQCGSIGSQIPDSLSTWSVNFSNAPVGTTCIEIPLDFGASGQPTPMTFSGGYVILEDASGERDYASIMGHATVLGGVSEAVPAYVLDTSPAIGIAGQTLHQTIVGTHLNTGDVVYLSNDSAVLPASHVTWLDDHTIDAVLPTAAKDVGTWDIVVSGQGGEAILEDALGIVESEGGQGAVVSLTDPTLSPDYIIIIPDEDGATAYRTTVQSLVNYRTAQGHSVLVADLDQIRTAWPASHDTTSIKDFLAFAYSGYRSMPQFLMLAGDARVQDPDFMIPFPMHAGDVSTFGGSYEYPYDAAYAFMERV